MGDPVAALAKSLASHVDELLCNSSPYELFTQTKIDNRLLQRAKMRLWDQWQKILLSTGGCTGIKATTITEMEISKAVVIIAYAALSSFEGLISVQANWDVDQFADCAKVSPNLLNDDGQQQHKLAKYFKAPLFSHITEPTTFIDKHGKILAWYLPDILVPDQMVWLLQIWLMCLK
ncbi:hypothetical protein BDR04DRAFT_1114141 [Suillus decipiens]|nr:hypothetical protein BDR04DRAFT_1114141 [Suillus decipiens]